MRFRLPAPLHNSSKPAGLLWACLLLVVCAATVSQKTWTAGALVVLSIAALHAMRLRWRRQSDDAMRRSEERLRISQRIAHIGSWDWDVVSGRMDCSEELCRIFAIPFEKAPASYRQFLELLPEEGRNAVAAAIEEALTGEDSFAIEYSLLRADGGERFLSEVGEVFRDDTGTPLRVVSVVHDVTERKEAESALFFEKRYRGLIENLPQRIYLKDCNSVYLSCNSSFARELGVEPGDVFGKTDYDLFVPQLAQKRQEYDEKVMAAGTAVERDEQRERDGAWVSKALIPLKDENGKVYGLLGVLTDITFRKRAEEQLKESEERFRTTFEQAAVGICHLALGGTLIRINRRFCDILGYTQDELLGWTLERTIHPEDLAAEKENAAKLANREIDNYSIEIRQLRKDGSLVFVNLTKSMVCGPKGEPKYLAGVIEDVTAEREAQTLRRERDLVQAASRAKSQFLANMGHEIRTPLNAVMGLSRLTLKTELNAKQRGYLETISSSSRTLLNIISDILDFSKIEAGKLELEAVPVELGDVFDRVATVIGSRAADKLLEVRFSLPAELRRPLVGDPLRLGQVLGNLAGNAVKFTERGEVVIEVAQAGPPDDGGIPLVFSVSDTGIGMSPEQAGKVFEPFSQADSSITRSYGGTGLGLAIVTRLLDLMGGRLSLDSEPGKGSRFSFTLRLGLPDERPMQMAGLAPAAQQGRSCPEPADPAPGPAGCDKAAGTVQLGALRQIRGARILIAEDNLINQQVLREILQRAGMSVEVVGSGSEAVAAVEAGEGIDLVFMDIQMPDMDGYQATRLIRGLPGAAGLPIVAMTAHALNEERDKCLDAGMNDHLAKPIDLVKLYAALVRWLEPRGGEGGAGFPAQPAPAAPPRGFPAALPGVDVATALNRVMGNGALLRKIMVDFRDGNRDAVRQIRQAVERHDLGRARRLVHTIKGLSGNLGAEAVFATAKELEAVLREGDCRGVAPLLATLAGEMALVFDAAATLEKDDQWRETAGPAPEPVPLAAAELACQLNELARMLSLNRMEAQKQFAQLKRHLGGAPELGALERKIALLEFKAALPPLRKLAERMGFVIKEHA